MRKIHFSWKLFLFLWCTAAPVSADWSAGIGVESFVWAEYSGDYRLLEESGPRWVALLDYAGEGKVSLRLSCRIYSGDVQYVGQYMDGTPANTTTAYSGGMAEAGFAVHPGQADSGTAVYLGLGIDSWDRNLTGPGGYLEQYQARYLKLGLENNAGAFDRWSTRFGIIWPFQVTETVHLYDGVSLNPKGTMSYYLGVGYRLSSVLEVAVDYRGLHFAPSEYEELDDNHQPVNSVRQPTSQLDAAMLSLQYDF